MTIVEVTSLMAWINEHRIDQYVKIDQLTDAILDMVVQPEPELVEVGASDAESN